MMPQSIWSCPILASFLPHVACLTPVAEEPIRNFAIRNPQFYVAGKDLVKKR